jgi:hypothetical protein
MAFLIRMDDILLLGWVTWEASEECMSGRRRRGLLVWVNDNEEMEMEIHYHAWISLRLHVKPFIPEFNAV